MKIKGLVLLSISVVLLVFICLRIVEASREGFQITLVNKTEQALNDLIIRYPTDSLMLGTISKNASITKHIQPSGDFGESEINLIYKDKNGAQHTERIFGYIEKGYRGKATVKINAINERGELTIVVNEKIGI